jgi:excinuclease ABC subunit A
VCGGKRFNQETLDIVYKGKTMAEILNLTFEEAAGFFSSVPRIRNAFQVVCNIGLGYLSLGQPSPTLSGGEAQRIKIAKELVSPQEGTHFISLMSPRQACTLLISQH